MEHEKKWTDFDKRMFDLEKKVESFNKQLDLIEVGLSEIKFKREILINLKSKTNHQ